MKIKLLVKLGEWVLGKTFSDEEPRADMYLPIWILALSLVLLVGGVAVGVVSVVTLAVEMALPAVAIIGLGYAALLCWKNQSIVMLPNDAFEYTTFLGNKKTYYYKEITGLRRNRDSYTLLLGDAKVHIEACAIMSDRLAERLDAQLELLYPKAR